MNRKQTLKWIEIKRLTMEWLSSSYSFWHRLENPHKKFKNKNNL